MMRKMQHLPSAEPPAATPGPGFAHRLLLRALLSPCERSRPLSIRLRLIATLFGRASNVFMVALAAMICGAAAVARGGGRVAGLIAAAEVCILVVRCGVILAFKARQREGPPIADPEVWLMRFGVLAVGSSVAWGGLCFVCLAFSHDPVLYVLPVLSTVGTAGAVAARNSGVPRLAKVQLAASLAPILAGSLLADDHGYRLLLLLVPAMAAGLLILVAERHQQLVDLIETQSELGRLSQTDALTQVSNRRFLDARLAAAAKGTPRPSALLMVDVDHFKAFNDRYGHPAGDELLRQIAAVLREHVRGAEDVVARYGGEEFAILLPNTDLVEACSIGERLRQAVQASCRHPLHGEGATISIGIAAGTSDPDRLVQEADGALYNAKRNGRNRLEAITASPQSPSRAA